MEMVESKLDVGPIECKVLKLATKKVSFERLVEFAQQDQQNVDKLADLLKTYKQHIEPHTHKKLIPFYVARWIHYNNRIEYSGFEDECDTVDLVLCRRVSTGSIQEKEVTQMLQLLQETYQQELNCLDRVTKKFAKIQKWHKTLLSGILKDPGTFRMGGVFSTSADGSTHFYPHHTTVEKSIRAWLNLCFVIAKEIHTYSVEPARIRYLFALAAFAQFHFVDIHPFPDGNGRMCRFISKFILDEVLPLPFPMFDDRKKYLDTLTNGRRLRDEDSPQFLFQLLLSDAVRAYEEIIARYKSYTTVIAYFSCSSLQELESELKKEKLNKEMEDQIKTEFSNLELNSSATIQGDKGVFQVFKTPPMHFSIELEDMDVDDL